MPAESFAVEVRPRFRVELHLLASPLSSAAEECDGDRYCSPRPSRRESEFASAHSDFGLLGSRSLLLPRETGWAADLTSASGLAALARQRIFSIDFVVGAAEDVAGAHGGGVLSFCSV